MDGAAPAFEQVLDAHVAAQAAVASRVVPIVDGRPDPGLRFSLSGAWFSTSPGMPASAATYGAPSPHATRTQRPGPTAAASTPTPEPAPVRRRPSSAAAREAHRRLRQWGAELPDDFTDADLKHAYRRLARQYHPDQHPSATAATRAALAGAFHQIHLMYRVLAAGSAAV